MSPQHDDHSSPEYNEPWLAVWDVMLKALDISDQDLSAYDKKSILHAIFDEAIERGLITCDPDVKDVVE
jgi:hypothetical protein